ncbi:MAG: sigma-70 family RNA polymerase sigma factor [Flavobacteriales bacterium]|nr:sigma-70 family RNA polymerase sigma factor [Flavobacteriales bacterium]
MSTARDHTKAHVGAGPPGNASPEQAGAALLGAMRRFHRELYAFIRNRTRDDELAKDLLQDTYLKALLKQDTVTDADKLVGWLYRIAGNTVADHFKKQRPRAALDDVAEEHDEPVLNERYVRCLPHMLRELDVKYGQALELELKGELPQQAIAEQLGISYTGAKSRIQRARVQLEELFRERCHYTADAYGNVVDDRCGDACDCSAGSGCGTAKPNGGP